MNQYTSFAYVYDTLMDNVPYGEWCQYVVQLLKKENIHNGIITELGCGTGTFCTLLADYGYKVIGVDISTDMLEVAAEKITKRHRGRILYTLQDMRDFILKKPVRAIISVCDSMNYLLSKADWDLTLRSVYQNLCPGGIFIFDLKTRHFYENVLGDNTIADNYKNCSFIWENHFDKKTSINEYHLSIFVRQRRNRYLRHLELHRQRAYDADDLLDLIKNAGFHLLHIYDACSFASPKADSERIYFIIKKMEDTHE